MATVQDLKIGHVVVVGRVRQDLGDIDALAKSIDEIGLLHPIVVTDDFTLIAGHRRLEACKRLGWTTVPAVTAYDLRDVMQQLQAERDENTCRKDFTPTEAVEMAARLKPIEKKAAKARQGARTDKHPEKFSGCGETQAKVAAAVGMSAPTLAKAEEVVEAAEADPDTFGDLPAKMDQTGKVTPVHREMLERQGKPTSPSPQQQSAESPARRWAKSVHDIFVLLNSTRSAGGVDALVSKWSRDERVYYAKELRRLMDEMSKWLPTLEAKEVA